MEDSDNDFIEIDFNRNFYRERNPIVVLFHGLEGSSSSYYSLAFYQACKELNFHYLSHILEVVQVQQ